MARGHTIQALLYEYPVALVKNLYRAALENRRREVESLAVPMSVAVVNALDMAFAGGKGRVLQSWLERTEALSQAEPGGEEKPCPRPPAKPSVLAWFASLPQFHKKQRAS